MVASRDIINAARDYLRGHPEEIARIVRSSFGLRFGLPLAAFRWLIENLLKNSDSLDPEIVAHPPGLGVAATIDKMDTKIRFSAIIYIQNIRVSADEARVEIRMEDVKLTVLSDKKTIVSALINSGALNISQIGNLVNELPGLPPFMAEAHENRLVIDLMKAPQFADNQILRHLVGALSSLITVHGVQTESEHLDVVLRALPSGGLAAVGAISEYVVSPGVGRVRALLGLSDRKQLREAF